jgi:hypothetical protein
MSKLGKTADGFIVKIGDTIYVVDTYEGAIRQHIIKEICNGRKVLFKEPLPGDYIGARLNTVYHIKENAERALKDWK